MEVSDTGVNIQWFNHTTQEAGGVVHFPRFCSVGNTELVTLCGHSWTATIRLHVGPNKIEVVANDNFGNIGRKRATVTRLPDTWPPTVTGTSPAAGATAVAINGQLTVTFSEAMDPSSVSTSTILVKDSSGNPVSGIVSYANRVATFTPSNPLGGLTGYVAQIGTGVKDEDGNALAVAFTWSFTTAAIPDTTPPGVISTSPANAEICVAADVREIAANFSEPIWFGGSLRNTEVRLQDDLGNAVRGTVTQQLDGLSALFTPASRLADFATYTGIVPAGLQDFAGNKLAHDYRWTFKTQPAGAGNWNSMSMANAPSPRYGHIAVWSGTELIVWGGMGRINDVDSVLGDGARYNPATNTWISMSMAGAPSPRRDHTAVWTGNELIVWGGSSPIETNSGAIYDPATDTWRPISRSGAPATRSGHTAAWTGSEMIIWGGQLGPALNDGGRYNPATDTWLPVSGTHAPGARFEHTAIWDGNAMHVWGGHNFASSLGDGASYSPSTDSWVAIGSAGAPAARHYHSAVWAGNEMIVWGGYDGSNPFGNGARFSPSTNTWRPVNQMCSPLARFGHKGVWTGTEMIIWGGTRAVDGRFLYTSGGRYDPIANAWSSTPITGVPEGRVSHSVTWTGAEVIVWGGVEVSRFKLGTGMSYRPQ